MRYVIGAVTAAMLMVGTGCQCPLTSMSSNQSKNITSIQFDNAWFYDKDGKFIEARGKDAYIALMKYHGYPVFPGMKEKLWVSDYGTGEFTKLGLGAFMFVDNDKDPEGYRFMLMDLFLLPGQMLPEHYHLKSAKSVEKMEGWLVRHGSVTIVGEGEPTPGIQDRQPKSQSPSSTVFHGEEATPGTFVKLNRVTARHSQLAGSEGVIESEVANFHDNSAVRHTNEKLIFN